MQVYSIDGIVPVIDPMAFVHPSAVLIGDVVVGPECYVGPCASLRGDFGRVILERGCNVQDTCVLHAFPGMDAVIEIDGHVGHGAVIHGCRVGRNALIGMNAVVMDGAVIGQDSIVAACSFVKAKFQCPAGSLVVGSPAVVKRELKPQEIEWKSRGTAEYQELANRSLVSMTRVEALLEVEQNRPRIQAGDLKPKYQNEIEDPEE